MNVFDVSMKQIRNGLVYLPNETKPFTGGFVGWYPNGQKKEEVNYIDGKEDGKYTQWYENGTKWIEQYYKDGKKDGNSILWFKNGQKRKESNYIDGKKTSFIVMRLKKIGINPKKWYFVIFTVVIIFFLN